MWNELDRRLRRLNEPVNNKEQLWKKIQSVWNNIEIDACTKLIRTMSQRIADVISQKGGYTRW